MDARDVVVMGLGYIGLPTASILATRGHRVLGVDVNADVVATISEGRIHIVEPELDVLVRSAVHSGGLTASTLPRSADVFLIAVPTPFREGHQPDISYVLAATRAIAPHLGPGNLVILESTSPVGTTEAVAETLFGLRPELRGTLRVAHCPERVLPGRILKELVENDRVVGGIDAPSTEAGVAFYRTFVTGEVLTTDARTAELCKLVENSYRDVNIAFANELSLLCDRLGIDVWTLIRLANRHPRVQILNPGPGVGGHCIAVDPWFVVSAAPDLTPLIATARGVNDGKAEWVVRRVLERAERFKEPVVAVLGLAYKPDIDDLRESPALHIARRVATALQGGRLLCVEPHVHEVDGLVLVPLAEALAAADIVVCLVAHRAFRDLDRRGLAGRVIIDPCGGLR